MARFVVRETTGYRIRQTTGKVSGQKEPGTGFAVLDSARCWALLDEFPSDYKSGAARGVKLVVARSRAEALAARLEAEFGEAHRAA